MITVALTRLETSEQGTFGVLRTQGFRAYSGELPWRENLPNISCIPVGLYRCVWTFSPRFKRHMYLVDGVEERTGVRIHSANLMGATTKGFRAQLNGCIALGEKLGTIGRQKALLISAPAMRIFETKMNKQTFLLEVTNG